MEAGHETQERAKEENIRGGDEEDRTSQQEKGQQQAAEQESNPRSIPEEAEKADDANTQQEKQHEDHEPDTLERLPEERMDQMILETMPIKNANLAAARK